MIKTAHVNNTHCKLIIFVTHINNSMNKSFGEFTSNKINSLYNLKISVIIFNKKKKKTKLI